ncbi:MAG: hypothetical protein ABH848_04780 [Candidatus Omnitrophota bacterium]
MKKSLIILIILMLIFTGTSFAAKKVKEKNVAEGVKVIGKLSSLSPINDPVYIGIELFDEISENSTGEGLMFIIDTNTTIENKRDMNDIRFGDTVMITYNEAEEILEDDTSRVYRTATSVKFLRSAGKTTEEQKRREEIQILVEIEKTLKGKGNK